jgi:hypothetical protein
VRAPKASSLTPKPSMRVPKSSTTVVGEDTAFRARMSNSIWHVGIN